MCAYKGNGVCASQTRISMHFGVAQHSIPSRIFAGTRDLPQPGPGRVNSKTLLATALHHAAAACLQLALPGIHFWQHSAQGENPLVRSVRSAKHAIDLTGPREIIINSRGRCFPRHAHTPSDTSLKHATYGTREPKIGSEYWSSSDDLTVRFPGTKRNTHYSFLPKVCCLVSWRWSHSSEQHSIHLVCRLISPSTCSSRSAASKMPSFRFMKWNARRYWFDHHLE